jgi:hypothetical protein
MAATEFTRRRFVTRAMVEDAHRAGQSLTLGPRDVITDEAGTRARDLGVAVVREGAGPGRPSGMPVSRPVPGSSSPAGGSVADAAASGSSPAAVKAAIRAAVVAELGTDDPRIDAAIDRVFARRGL